MQGRNVESVAGIIPAGIVNIPVRNFRWRESLLRAPFPYQGREEAMLAARKPG
jgi:hypothetical protein